MSDRELPAWANRLLPHLRGAALVAKSLRLLAVHLAIVVLIGWMVVGTLCGYVTPTSLIGRLM